MKTNLYQKSAYLVIAFALIVFFSKCQKETNQSTKNQPSEKLESASKTNPNSFETANVICAPTGSNHYIAKDLAKKMIDKYQEAIRRGSVGSIVNSGGWTFAETFTGSDVVKLLSQPNCCNFRIYYGLGITDNRMHAILVGTAPSGKDLFSYVPTTTASEPPPPPVILEAALPCPQICIGVYPN